jgi:hypothetical protein
MRASFNEAPSYFMHQIKALQLYITPNCAVGACVDSTTNTNSKFLAPDTFKNMICQSNIQLCLASTKVAGSVMPGAVINQSCQTSIGLPGSVPTSAGPSVSCSTPSANTPASTPASAPAPNRGFSNEQVVVTNANAPSPSPGTFSPATNFAVVASPSGSSTTVTSTGTPGGGIQQTIQSNAPVSLQSSGPAPVTYIMAPVPAPRAPVPSPSAPVPAPTPANNNNLIAGGSLLGISFSFMFFILGLLVLFMVFGGKGKGKRPISVPTGL